MSASEMAAASRDLHRDASRARGDRDDLRRLIQVLKDRLAIMDDRAQRAADRIRALELTVADHETRLAALEAPAPTP